MLHSMKGTGLPKGFLTGIDTQQSSGKPPMMCANRWDPGYSASQLPTNDRAWSMCSTSSRTAAGPVPTCWTAASSSASCQQIHMHSQYSMITWVWGNRLLSLLASQGLRGHLRQGSLQQPKHGLARLRAPGHPQMHQIPYYPLLTLPPSRTPGGRVSPLSLWGGRGGLLGL